MNNYTYGLLWINRLCASHYFTTACIGIIRDFDWLFFTIGTIFILEYFMLWLF